jgi:hypothetical protein
MAQGFVTSTGSGIPIDYSLIQSTQVVIGPGDFNFLAGNPYKVIQFPTILDTGYVILIDSWDLFLKGGTSNYQDGSDICLTWGSETFGLGVPISESIPNTVINAGSEDGLIVGYKGIKATRYIADGAGQDIYLSLQGATDFTSGDRLVVLFMRYYVDYTF